METLTIITVNYHSEDFVENLQKTLLKQQTSFAWTLKVRDNNQDNIGYGRALNDLGLNINSPFLLIINPDVELLDENTLEESIRIMKNNSEIGVLGPKTIDQDGIIQWSYDFKPTVWRLIFDKPLAFLYKHFGKSQHVLKVLSLFSVRYDFEHKHDKIDWVSGAFMLIRTDLFKSVGGFDPKIFMYYEDIDLCLRIKKLGKFIYYDPNIVIKHYVGQSSPDNKKKSELYYQSQKYFFQKHESKFGQTILALLGAIYQKLNLKYKLNRY